jgi:hypothetical protein
MPVLVQVISGILFRPAPAHTLRPLWNYAHNNWGLIIVPLGLVNVYLGALLYIKGWVAPDDQRRVLLAWVLPTSIVPGALLVVEVVLQSWVRVTSARKAAEQTKVEIVAATQKEEREVESSSAGSDIDPSDSRGPSERPSMNAAAVAVGPCFMS